MRSRPLLSRLLGRAARGLVMLLLALGALLLVALLGANLPWVQRWLAREASELVSRQITGTLTVTEVGRVGLLSLQGVDAELTDAEGRRVLAVSGLKAELDGLRLVRSWLGDGPLELGGIHIAADVLDVDLHADSNGELDLLQALEPHQSSAAAGADTAATPLVIEIDALDVREVRARGGAALIGVDPRGEAQARLEQLSLRARLDPDRLRLELKHARVELRNVPLIGAVSGELAGMMTLSLAETSRHPLAADAHWRGSLGQLPVEAGLVFAERHLAGFLRSEASPRAVMQLWPEGGWARELGDAEPIDVLLAFEGPLDAITARAVLESSGGDLYIDGRIDLERLGGQATLIGEQLDLARWLAAAPATSLRFVAALAFEHAQGSLTGRLALRSGPGSIAGQALPSLALSAELRPSSLDARLRPELAGADAVLAVTVPLGSDDGAEEVAFDLRAEVSDLALALAQLGVSADVSVRGTLRARGRLELGPARLSRAHLRAELRSLAAGAARVERVSIDAAARGPLDQPGIELRVDARRLSLEGHRVERLVARAEGAVDDLRLRAEIRRERAAPLQLRARFSPIDQSLSDVALTSGAGREAVRVSVRAARVTSDGYAIERLVVRSGSGKLQLDGALRGDALHVQARASDFSAAAVARGLGLGLELPEGVADLSLQLERRAGRFSGTLSGSVTELGLGPLQGGALRADLVAEHGVLRGLAGLSAAPFGEVRLRLEQVELPARWRASALTGFEGRVEILALADLGSLASVEAIASLMRGTALDGSLEAQLSLHGDGGSEPNAHLALTTRELGWTLPRDARLVDAAPVAVAELPRSSTGLDLELSVDLHESKLEAHAALIGAGRAVLAGLRGSAPLPLARLLREPQSVDPRALPFDARFYIPERELSDFPAPLRFSGVDGRLRADVSARGRLGRPELTAHVELAELRLDSSRRALPLTIVADARLDADRLRASGAVRDERRKLVSLAVDATLGGGAGGLKQAELDLRSNGLPLAAIGALLGREIGGELYGALSLQANGEAPSATGTLWVNSPSYHGFRQKQARWTFEAGPRAFSTAVTLAQDGGGARLMVNGPWRWEGSALPTVDRRRLHATLRANRFDLRALAPLLPDQSRGVAGRLDAEFEIDPSRADTARGLAHLREGQVYVAALGQEFRDITLDARLQESGDVAIERLSARALDGRLSAEGEVGLEGLAFRRAELDVNISRGAPLPVALEGVTVATAWGHVDVSARAEGGNPGEPSLLSVDVRVPRLQVVLPRLSPQSVQELTEDPTIDTGTFVAPGRFTTLPLPPYDAEAEPEPDEPGLTVRVNVELGDEVWIEREPELEVKLVGAVELELRDELAIEGQLRLARGNIEVQGRTFQIERGEITFYEEREPDNPTVVATGVYTAAEGTRVYAEFVGPVESGKLTLRSEPPLRDDQILSLLLFGSADGSFGSSTSESPADPLETVSGTALVAGGNVVAQGLNVELRRLTSLDIQTRIGSREGEPQPEVAVQLTPRLTAELAYRLEAPTPGRAPDRTYLTLDLRLFRNWSLSTTIGDAGSFVLDLLWRYRY